MNPLDNLKDIHAPSAIDVWPPAYGWWILAMLILVAIVLTSIWAIKSYNVRAAKRQALQELALIDRQDKDGLAKLNQLLKRAAIRYFTSINVHQMYGEDWIKFLSTSINKKQNKEFVKNITGLQQSLYQQASTDNFDSYKKHTSDWLRTALPPKKSVIKQLEQEHA
ncbi:DUF4381 domain-containing protein [Paraglaciecola marina]|uniref:DUF4381 domain-containing protein n=1 Tax=Paraglaciecola marina TaxID=2500157 RepID=UPI00105B25D8|nr:DUF4381 domain-containing protein [Paraglaciecola marina]